MFHMVSATLVGTWEKKWGRKCLSSHSTNKTNLFEDLKINYFFRKHFSCIEEPFDFKFQLFM